MKNIDMPRMAACFTIYLVVSTLVEQFTPLGTGGSLLKALVANALVGAFVVGGLFFMGRFRRGDRQHV